RALVARPLWTAKTRAETEEDGRLVDIALGNVGDGDVFTESAVFRLEREAVAAIEDAVGDGDVLEAAVGFSAAFNTAGAVGVGVGTELLERAIEDGTQFV